MTQSLEWWRERRDARRADKSLTRVQRYGGAARKRRNGFNSFKRKAWAKAYKARMDAGLENCRVCRSSTQLTWDHIVPISKGGTWAKTNMTILCWLCNRKKAWQDVTLQSLADEEATKAEESP